MASNFDFFKKIDKELFDIIEEAQNLFRSEYFNQCIIQTRIFAERMAKKISDNYNSNSTFDDILNNLKDRIKTEREKEFIEDLFFIKKQGNACAHGEEATVSTALEVIRRAFEAAISYAYYKKKDENIDKLLFDETLLITQTSKKEDTLIDKYLKRAQEQKEEISKEELLNKKQGEFLSQVVKKEDEENALEDKYNVKNPKQYKKNQKKEFVKQKIKQAKKVLKENVNNKEIVKKSKTEKNKNKTKEKKQQKKKTNTKRQEYTTGGGFLSKALFLLFVIISLILLAKILFDI